MKRFEKKEKGRDFYFEIHGTPHLPPVKMKINHGNPKTLDNKINCFLKVEASFSRVNPKTYF
jgi:hypothetical protein